MLGTAGPRGRRPHRHRAAGRRGLSAALALALLAAGACSSSEDGTGGAAETTTTTTATTAAAPRAEPGSLVSTEPIDAPAGARVWNVRYRSRSIDDREIEVTGVVAVPDRETPEGGFPVIAWAHGTTGAADQCAPSRIGAGGAPDRDALLAAGYAVAETDYEGLGTPGPHPYLVGESEGRGVLDAVRAARALPDSPVGDRVVVWGHSQGGHGALFAGEIADEYAPELEVLGVAALAPASEVEGFLDGASRFSFVYGFFATIVSTWSRTYPDASLDDALTPRALELLDVVDRECLPGVLAAFRDVPVEELNRRPLVDVEPWADLARRNTAGHGDTGAPILLLQGERDPLIPTASTRALEARLCGNGEEPELRVYPDADHSGVVAASQEDLLEWTAARLEGNPAGTTCPA